MHLKTKEADAFVDAWGSSNSNLFITQPCENIGTESFVRRLARKHLSYHPNGRDEYESYLELRYPAGDERELQLFYASPSVHCKFYNQFIGTFVIDISLLVKDQYSNDLNRLLEYIKQNNQQIRYILVATGSDREALQFLYGTIRFAVQLIEQVSIDVPPGSQFAEWISQQRALQLTDSCRKELAMVFQDLSDLPGFQGYKTAAAFAHVLQREHSFTVQAVRDTANRLSATLLNTPHIQKKRIGFE